MSIAIISRIQKNPAFRLSSATVTNVAGLLVIGLLVASLASLTTTAEVEPSSYRTERFYPSSAHAAAIAQQGNQALRQIRQDGAHSVAASRPAPLSEIATTSAAATGMDTL
jgi:hypothetical protein